MYDPNKYPMALICHKKLDCSDDPIIVIIGHQNGETQTSEVLEIPEQELNSVDQCRLNGIPRYRITISEHEYEIRFRQGFHRLIKD